MNREIKTGKVMAFAIAGFVLTACQSVSAQHKIEAESAKRHKQEMRSSIAEQEQQWRDGPYIEREASGEIPPSSTIIGSIRGSIGEVESEFKKRGIGDFRRTVNIPFADQLVELGCKGEALVPAGIPRERGDMNGAMQAFSCDGAVILAYHFDYTLPITQSVTVYDREYALNPDANLKRVRFLRERYKNGSFSKLNWLNPYHQLKIEIFEYDDSDRWSDAAFEVLSKYVESFVETAGSAAKE